MEALQVVVWCRNRETLVGAFPKSILRTHYTHTHAHTPQPLTRDLCAREQSRAVRTEGRGKTAVLSPALYSLLNTPLARQRAFVYRMVVEAVPDGT
jgi:hypothetical protein